METFSLTALPKSHKTGTRASALLCYHLLRSKGVIRSRHSRKPLVFRSI